MKKSGVALIWPILVAPLAALATLWLSGATYTDAPDQGAMLVRFLALLLWIGVAFLGSVLTPLIVKTKLKRDWLLCLLAGLGSVAIFYFIIVLVP